MPVLQWLRSVPLPVRPERRVAIVGGVALALLIGLSLSPLNGKPSEHGTGRAAICKKEDSQLPVSLWERTQCDPVAYWTLWLMGFTGALVVVSSVQIGFLIRADKTAARSADAAKRAAEASIIGQRAFVFLSTTPTMQANENVAMTPGSLRPLQFANFGSTPAQIDSLTASCRYWTISEFRDLKAQPDGATTEVAAVWLAGAGAELGVQTVRVFATAEEIRSANQVEPHGVIALLGYLRYRDMFDESHEVGFAYVMTGTKKVTMHEIPTRHLNYSR